MGDFDTTSRSAAIIAAASSALPPLAHELVKHRIPEYETVLYIPRKFRAQGINSRLLFEGVLCPGARKCDTLYWKQCLMFSVKWDVWSLQYLDTQSRKNVKKINKKYLLNAYNILYLHSLNAYDISIFRMMRYFSHFVGFSFIWEVLNNGLTRIFYFYSFKLI